MTSARLEDLPLRFAYRRHADQDAPGPVRHPVVIVGAGPVGLSLAIDLATRGIASVVLDDSDRIGEGSRAICFAKRTLEIFDRLGLGEALVEKGVTWQRGRFFLGERELYDFDLLPEAGHRRPAFINIQQYYVEAALAARAADFPDLIDLRWSNRLAAVAPRADGVTLTIDTPDGPYRLEAEWLVACDGSRSPTRAMLGLDFAGEVFDDRFLIADVKMTADFPTERWFWFQPPFHGGQSALLHKQPDDVWRIDLQLGRDADAEVEKRPENVCRASAGCWATMPSPSNGSPSTRFSVGVSPASSTAASSSRGRRPSGLTLRCARRQFRHPGCGEPRLEAGARSHRRGRSRLIATYDLERGAAADENILNSTRATDFIAPPSAGERRLRDAVLALAAEAPFARRLVNSGRLSVPTTYGRR